MPNEFGFLKINVTTAGGALPVESAKVTVRSAENGNETVAVIYSDRAGVCERIRLPAPDKDNAMRPGGELPYTFYSVEAQKTGFFTVSGLSVPIYSEVTAIQPVTLVPITEDSGGNPIEYESHTGRLTVPDLE